MQGSSVKQSVITESVITSVITRKWPGHLRNFWPAFLGLSGADLWQHFGRLRLDSVHVAAAASLSTILDLARGGIKFQEPTWLSVAYNP